MATKQAPSPLPISASLRVFLYVTATLTGGMVLVIEILGAKTLTPWFGSSHFVWTAQIAITLLALAFGYYLGGWLADRTDRLVLVYGGLAAAAAYLVLLVPLANQLSAACLSLNLALGSMLASFALFFVPLTLLAAVGPFFIRRLTRAVDNVGQTVGRLTALGTVGSVLGVLVTSYVLVPYCKNSSALLGTAGALVLLAVVYVGVWGRADPGRSAVATLVGIAFVLSLVALRRPPEPIANDSIELAQANSHFGTMQVLESRDGRARYYLNDLLMQNSYEPAQGRSLSMFTEALYHLSLGYTPEIRRVLCIGMGVGIVPRRFAADGLAVDVVEINPRVVPLAQKWFGFDPTRVNLTIDDARHFLRISTQRYDTIQLDAFLGDSSPAHLMSREAFGEMRARLNPGGTLVINSFAAFDPGRDFFGTSLHRTLHSVFAEVRVHASPGGNMFFVASDRSPLIYRPPAEGYTNAHPWVRPQLEAALAQPHQVDIHRGLVLTDDYNPVEFFDARSREATRRLLARAATTR